MSDNRAAEKSVSDVLRELLDERGVEYKVDECNAITEWSTHYGAFVFFARQREGKLLVETTVATEHSVILTPEQAIAMTLGVDVKDCENLLWEFIGALDVADATDADKKPIVSDYARHIAATLVNKRAAHGTLTAEQVEKAIHDCSTYASYDGCTYYASGIRLQAIADELNAELGGGNCARCAEDMGRYADSLCDPLKERIAELLRCLENDWHIHASWDGLRKFWCIELTEEGVRMRDAELGSGTCEPKWTLQGETQTQEFWRCECGNCGECFGVESRESFPFKMTVGKVDTPNFCPNCGKRIKKAVE